MRVDMSLSRTYITRPVASAHRTGVLILSSASYPVSWGVSTANGPHMRLNEPDAESVAQGYGHYACDLALFLETYADVDDMPGTYVKNVTTKAVILEVDTVVDTKEGPMSAKAGDYACEDARGNQWPVRPAVFDATYREA